MQVSLPSLGCCCTRDVATAKAASCSTTATTPAAYRAAAARALPCYRHRHRAAPSLSVHARARCCSVSSASVVMASSPARRPRLRLLMLALLLTVLSPRCAVAASERRRVVLATAALPPAGRASQEFHVAPRPLREWRRRVRRGRGGGTGAWTFSAMLPRGFVPPSGSSACHNDMPATAADVQFFACSGAATP